MKSNYFLPKHKTTNQNKRLELYSLIWIKTKRVDKEVVEYPE